MHVQQQQQQLAHGQPANVAEQIPVTAWSAVYVLLTVVCCVFAHPVVCSANGSGSTSSQRWSRSRGSCGATGCPSALMCTGGCRLLPSTTTSRPTSGELSLVAYVVRCSRLAQTRRRSKAGGGGTTSMTLQCLWARMYKQTRL